ncbi:MAG: 2Fe-2S iron-sulfur cluster binding domain-containing protein, partial [Candidatus Bathyarchaeota archaeon]
MVSSKRYKVTFQPEGKRTEVSKHSSVMDAAKLLGVDLIALCGSKGKCGKCKIIISEKRENAGSITEIEKSQLSNNELSSGYRLACCTAIKGSLNVIIPEQSRTGTQRLQTEGIDTRVPLEPFVKKFYVQLPLPTLQDPQSDVDRLSKELFSRHHLQNLQVEYDLLKRLPQVLRDNEWKVTAIVWGDNQIVDIEGGDTQDRNYGYAVDVGTTKLAGYLLSLNNGKILAVGSLMNPQISFGEDLITRISYATKGSEKANDLQQAVVSGINQILMEVCQKMDIDPTEIYEMTAVGNTAMHHLFFGLNPKYLSLSPYPPLVRDSLNVEPDKIGVNINPNGNIHFLPVIAGFVGADTVAVILSTELFKRDELCFAVDIGT